MTEQSDNNTLGKGLGLLAEALSDKDNEKLATAARLIELMCDDQHVSRISEPILRTFVAFSFEVCGETPRSKRSYAKMLEFSLPLETIFGSKELAKDYTKAISYFGVRNIDGFKILANNFFASLKIQQEHLDYPLGESELSDLIVSLGMLDSMLAYCEVLDGTKQLSNLALEFNH